METMKIDKTNLHHNNICIIVFLVFINWIACCYDNDRLYREFISNRWCFNVVFCWIKTFFICKKKKNNNKLKSKKKKNHCILSMYFCLLKCFCFNWKFIRQDHLKTLWIQIIINKQLYMHNILNDNYHRPKVNCKTF